MNNQHPTNALHGIKLEQKLTELVEFYGYKEMARWVNIRCFIENPSVKSSLKFLRKTPWAREKVEILYLEMLNEKNKIKEK